MTDEALAAELRGHGKKQLPDEFLRRYGFTYAKVERYLSVLYDCLHEKLYDCYVIQVDETLVLVNWDGYLAGSQSYM